MSRLREKAIDIMTGAFGNAFSCNSVGDGRWVVGFVMPPEALLSGFQEYATLGLESIGDQLSAFHIEADLLSVEGDCVSFQIKSVSPKSKLDRKIHEAIEEFEMGTGTITKSLVVNFDRAIKIESV